ncbi:MAG TPA: hypothetical protein VFB32_16420 [Rudaea sp.]|nr:hypothetical protein [Rudaea sp.]
MIGVNGLGVNVRPALAVSTGASWTMAKRAVNATFAEHVFEYCAPPAILGARE